MAYLGIEIAKENQASGGSSTNFSDLNLKIPEMSVQLVERLVKVHKSPHKCHRSILDTEMKFLKETVEWMRNGNSVDAAVHCNG